MDGRIVKEPDGDEPGEIVLNEHDSAVYLLQNQLAAISQSPHATDKHHNLIHNKLQEAFNRWPHSRPIQYLLGTHCMMVGQIGTAISLLRYCMMPQIEKEGDRYRVPDAWTNLAAAYKGEHMDELAEQCYLKALAQAADKPGEEQAEYKANALHGIASLYINRGTPQTVIEWSDKALKYVPNDRFALWNKGLALLESGDYGPGFDLYDEAGFMDTQGKARDRKLKEYGGRLKRWNGEKGVKVVCYGEQGVGDELMFFTMLPDLMRDCQVIIECDKRIESLLRVSFPDTPIYATSDIDAPYEWLDLPENADCTHYVPCGSLGRYYRRTAADFPGTPYLKAEPWRVAKWAETLKDFPRPRIAISWAGGLKKTRMDKRSIPLQQWRPILEQDATFFSLQYHPEAMDATSAIGTELGKPVFHWADVCGGPGSGGYAETAAFLQSMDLVITVNTSLVHLCGALGVPTLCLTPLWRAWRYSGKSGPHPWYGQSVEQINQFKDGEWAPVIAEAARRVAKLVRRSKGEAEPEVVTPAVARAHGANPTPKQKRERHRKSKDELKRLRKQRNAGVLSNTPMEAA